MKELKAKILEALVSALPITAIVYILATTPLFSLSATELITFSRGVVKEEAAAFFGITLHQEKEILMMVVEKSIRDNVLNAIYKQMGMDKKARGIAFSLPVSDVAGLAPVITQTAEAEV